MKTLTSSRFFLAALFFGGLAVVGCSSSASDGTDPEAGDEQDVVPASAKTLFDQAGVCDNIFKRHAAIRDTDIKDGLLRWECGDVPGVTGSDLGQEYCEYHATTNGKLATKSTDIKAGQKLSCVFTGVFADVKANKTATDKFATTLGTALADKANLGVAADPNLMVMKVGFNSRGAASALFKDCATNANTAPADESRQAACYAASLVATPANQKKLTTACRGKNLNDEKKWAAVVKMGAKVAVPGDKDYETQHDLVACLRTAAAKGITWRNSDPMICTRVTRAVNECKVAFAPVPDAVDGFTFTGWTNRSIPAGCRYAKVGGKDYTNIVICEASSAEVEDIDTNPAWVDNLQQFCHDRFANDLVMQAPIRALQTAGIQDGAFCANYNKGFKPPTTKK